MRLKLNQAISKRLSELLNERNMTQYQLYMKSGVPKSTIGNIMILLLTQLGEILGGVRVP